MAGCTASKKIERRPTGTLAFAGLGSIKSTTCEKRLRGGDCKVILREAVPFQLSHQDERKKTQFVPESSRLG